MFKWHISTESQIYLSWKKKKKQQTKPNKYQRKKKSEQKDLHKTTETNPEIPAY